MNERYNRIMGCRANVDAANTAMEIAAKRTLEHLIEMDGRGELQSQVVDILRGYRYATENYAYALEQLADALRQ